MRLYLQSFLEVSLCCVIAILQVFYLTQSSASSASNIISLGLAFLFMLIFLLAATKLTNVTALSSSELSNPNSRVTQRFGEVF